MRIDTFQQFDATFRALEQLVARFQVLHAFFILGERIGQGKLTILQPVEQAEGTFEPLAGARSAHRGSGGAARCSSIRRRISEIIVSE